MNIRSQRGSALIVALIFGGFIAIALTSYLKLASTALNLSQRSFLANDTMNITEAGLEQALWSFNQANASNANAWSSTAVSGSSTGWQQGLNANDKKSTFSGFSLSQGATGSVQIYVMNYNSTGNTGLANNPTAIARATIVPAQGPTLTKIVAATFQRRSFFGTGLVAKNGLIFKGNNATVDSWNSTYNSDGTLRGTPVAYYYNSTDSTDPKNNRRPYGSIAAVNVTATIDVQNANIFGYVSVGSSDAGAISIGSQGTIGDFSTATGTLDTNHIATNFTANLPEVTLPTYNVVNAYSAQQGVISGKVTLPKGGDNPASDGKYYYTAYSIDQEGNKSNDFTVTAGKNVVLILSAPAGSDAIKAAGSGGIVISAGATLTIYAGGNINITGDSTTNTGGVLNNNVKPENFLIWGTNTTSGTQQINIRGNGSLSALVYAPYATTTVNGNGDIQGSFVADTVTFTGNANFHYDESLANYGGNNPFKISKWHELVTIADRAVYASQLGAF